MPKARLFILAIGAGSGISLASDAIAQPSAQLSQAAPNKFCLKSEDATQVCFTNQGSYLPPIDPGIFEEQQARLREELRRRAENARQTNRP